MERTMTLPYAGAGKRSLREDLEANGIRVLDPDLVRAEKKAFVAQLRTRGPVIGWFARIVTDMRAATVATVLLVVLGSVIPGIAWAIAPLSAAIGVMLVAVWARTRDNAAVWQLRDAGAHWRRARLQEGKEGGYEFQGARPLMDDVPEEADGIIDTVAAMPGTRVRVEYCSHDPYVVVTRGSILSRETAYVYHW